MKKTIKIILSIVILYFIIILFIPKASEKIDSTTKTTFSSNISNNIKTFFKSAKDSTKSFIDNPTPNLDKKRNDRLNIQ